MDSSVMKRNLVFVYVNVFVLASSRLFYFIYNMPYECDLWLNRDRAL
jgi:hypothetical protein